MEEDDDARHRREEAERRAKRKAAKQGSRGDSARAKRKEHAQRILSRQKGGSSSGQSPSASSSSGNKRHKGDKPPPPPPPLPPGATPSQFQNLFTQRAQGFQIEFRFRNAPPRPPVGPCFVGHSLDGVLVERSRQYKAHNAVEVNYKWKLHSEPDLGVPLAPSAMDVKSYKPPKQAQEDDENNNNSSSHNKNKKTGTTNNGINKLHPDDEALLNWKGSLGDTAAEALKKRQDQLRAAARLALAEGKGRIPNILLPANTEKLTSPSQVSGATVSGKKSFSRVLDEGMQTWMKKTTYLSNDYTRKVHDFKSLANTKQKEAQDLEHKQQQMNLRRSSKAITKTFAQANMAPVHPTKKNMKPKAVMSLLPNVQHWGFSYTHVVIDKATDSLDLKKNDLNKTFVANVETQNNRMICQMWAPPPVKGDDDSDSDSDEEKDDPDAAERDKNDLPNTIKYRPIQKYNLDVIPLKEEDQPHSNFCLWVDPTKKLATYLPLSSRVQLATGRPVKRRTLRKVARRVHTSADLDEINERKAEVDADIAEKTGHTSKQQQQQQKAAAAQKASAKDDDDDDDDDGDDDFGDSDDSDAKPAASSNNKNEKGDDDDSDDDEEETFGGQAGKSNAADDDDDDDDDDD